MTVDVAEPPHNNLSGPAFAKGAALTVTVCDELSTQPVEEVNISFTV